MAKDKEKNLDQFSMDPENNDILIIRGDTVMEDCPFCEDGTLYIEQKFHPDNSSANFTMKAKVCDSCGSFVTNEVNMNTLLTDIRVHSEKPYEGSIIVNGKVSPLTLH